MKTLLVLLALSLSLAACGVKGDPEAPPANLQAQ
jgi:predicted small lipoprotein YifL